MDDLLDETWHRREFPVLREAARLLETSEAGQGAPSGSICAATGLDDTAVFRALKALEAEGLVTVRWVMPSTHARVVEISGQARRLVGLWPPAPADGVERMFAALEAIADDTNEDDDTRSRARKALDGLTGAGKHIALAMATAYATGQIPGQ